MMAVSGGWLAWECAVFALFVCVTTCAPLWGRRGAARAAAAGGGAKRGYVFAAGGVSTLAMMLSVSRGTLGVRSFLGFPSELVYYGSAMWETVYGMLLAFPLVCFLFVPVYLPLGVVSVYQYLELRFRSTAVRRLAAATFVWRQLLNLAVTLYTPSVALHAVLGLPHWVSAAAIMLIGVFFTLLGGLRAAIKADVIQTVTMVAISVAFLAQGVVQAGGARRVLHDNVSGERLQFFNFTWDLTTRVDTLSALIGQLFMSVSIYGCQQTFVQRYCSMPNEGSVRRTLMLTMPVVGILFSLSWVVGMALYAVYRHCDPLASGQLASMDEVLPYYVQEHFTWLPGMLGLFLGSLFNGALSFLVSNVNSLATVTWEDFLSAAPPFRGATDRQQLTIIKIVGVVYCGVIVGLSLVVGAVGGVVESSQLVTSATSGPLLGVFLLAVLVPVANSKGAVAGMVTSHAVTTWMAVGHMLVGRKEQKMLPLLTDGCANYTSPEESLAAELNRTLLEVYRLMPSETRAPGPAAEPNVSLFYATSYMWYAFLGTTVCVAVGAAVSAATARPEPCDPRLLHPLARPAPLAPPAAATPPPAPAPAPLPAPPPAPAPAPLPAPPPASAVVGCRLFDPYGSDGFRTKL